MHVGWGSGCVVLNGEPDGPLTASGARPSSLPPEPKRRRVRGKQADSSGAFASRSRDEGLMRPSSPKRPRLHESGSVESGSGDSVQHETCASLINRAFKLSDDCSVAAVWKAAELRCAAGEAAYEECMSKARFAGGAMQTSQLSLGQVGDVQLLHDVVDGSVVLGAAEPLGAAGDAACAASCGCEPTATTSHAVAAGAAGEAVGHGSPHVRRQPLGCGAAAFDLPPEDDMLQHELLAVDVPGFADDDEDVFDFNCDMGPPAYRSR